MHNPFLDKPIQELNDVFLNNIRPVGEQDPVGLCHPGSLQLPLEGAAWQWAEGWNIFIKISCFLFPYTGSEDMPQPMAVLLLVRWSKEWTQSIYCTTYFW